MKSFVFFFIKIIVVIILLSCSQSLMNDHQGINYYWIQHTDYSISQFPVSSYKQAVSVFEKIDWPTEWLSFDSKNYSSNCIPGIGFHDGDINGEQFSHLIHICPQENGYFYFNFHYKKINRVFGLFPFVSSRVFFKENMSLKEINHYIDLFFSGEFQKIIKD